jgi:hypothetical protein
MDMKLANMSALAVAACFSAGAAWAQIELVTNPAPQCVFLGDARSVSATFHNPGGQDFRQDIRAVISQTTSATVVPVGERPWKELRVLPGQTVLESAQLDFPPVKAETTFLVQWVYGTGDIIGKTEVLVYPTNLLAELKQLVDESEDNLGVLDSHNQLKPALRHAAVRFVELGETELDSFHGKLALVGPSGPDDPEWRGLPDRIAKLAQKGTPVVWIQSPPQKRDKIWPSFFTVPENTNAVVMVQPGLVAGLPDNPQSQLNLLYFCRLALNPQPLTLPEFSPNP